MKVLVLYDYPASPGGLATQGDLMARGLTELGVEVRSVHFESAQEKEWYYRWFEPDVVLGVGYWGHTPHLVLHPQRYGASPVPWLVADGYIANYHEVLNALPLILVTSNWVKEMYIRDGIDGANIEVLPVGCDTDAFVPRDSSELKVRAVREALGVSPDQLMVLTIGGDATSQGRAGGHAGSGDQRPEGAGLEVRVQGLAAASNEAAEPDRPAAGHAVGDREERCVTQRTSFRAISCRIWWRPATSTPLRRGSRASEWFRWKRGRAESR